MKFRLSSRFPHLLAATVAVCGAFSAILPVLAQTAAGTAISNTATATYTDGAPTPTSFNATSNTVTIAVTEVAGITVTAQSPSVPSPNAGDSLFVDFVITNTGNDPTQFFIPGVATLGGANPGSFSVGTLQIIAVDGVTLGSPVNVPTAGATTATLNVGTNGSFAANPGTGTTGTVTVRVPVTALGAATAGNTTTVSLGNTATTNAQNQDRTGNLSTSGSNSIDVYTVDNTGTTNGDTAGEPANSTANIGREAMATSTPITVNARLQAFATILKANGSYINNGTPNLLTDDTLTYSLALRVENPTTPPTGLAVTDLHATQINLNGANSNQILVSDAIPANTQLAAANPTAPAGWTAVYSTSPLTTNAHAANWVTSRPGSGITRVGFVAAGPITKGTTVSGFSFDVTPLGSFTGGQIANIAQVFGQSQPGAVVPGTATQLVYDESGDQTPNNGLDGTNPDPTNGGTTAANGGVTPGVADPAADGVDPGTGNDPTNTGNTNQGPDTGTNSGTKPAGGEVTVFTIAATPLNGPDAQPAAVGPTNNNDDFTNKSIVLPPNLDPALALTDAQTGVVTFQNTVQNTSGGTQTISLVPTPPAVPGALPTNTIVTIDADGSGPGSPVTFTYNGTTFTTTGAVPTVTLTAGATTTYTVTVDLPGLAAGSQLTGYPVPITAFVDQGAAGLDAGDPSNTTIDRVYTGYLNLVKEARILEANGTTEVVGFTTNQATLSPAATPGRIIEYRITYTNISTGQGSGANNGLLPANSLVITESGIAGTNNWFSSTLDPVYPTPANGSASGTGGTIAVTTAANGAITDIQVYTNTVGNVLPQGTGTFTFQRKIK